MIALNKVYRLVGPTSGPHARHHYFLLTAADMRLALAEVHVLTPTEKVSDLLGKPGKGSAIIMSLSNGIEYCVLRERLFIPLEVIDWGYSEPVPPAVAFSLNQTKTAFLPFSVRKKIFGIKTAFLSAVTNAFSYKSYPSDSSLPITLAEEEVK